MRPSGKPPFQVYFSVFEVASCNWLVVMSEGGQVFLKGEDDLNVFIVVDLDFLPRELPFQLIQILLEMRLCG